MLTFVEFLEEEMGTGAVATPSGHSVDTSSVPDPANIGFKKRDKRRKHDTERMYRRNLIGKAFKIVASKK